MTPLTNFKGIFPVVATPFYPQGDFDEAGFRSLLAHLGRSGADGLLLFGIASEFHKLTDQEREKALRIFLEYPMTTPMLKMVSLTDQTWEVALPWLRRVQSQGADAVNVFPPHFLKPSRAAIKEHLARLAEAASVPLIVQYAPRESGVELEPEFFLELAAAHPMLAGVKVEVQPPGSFIARLAQVAPRLQTLVGYAGVNMLDALARGASAIQPGSGFVEVYRAIWMHYAEGEEEAARRLYARLLPYLALWMQHPEYIIAVEKEILRRRGIIRSAYCRGARWTLDARDEQVIDRFLREFLPQLKPRTGEALSHED